VGAFSLIVRGKYVNARTRSSSTTLSLVALKCARPKVCRLVRARITLQSSTRDLWLYLVARQRMVWLRRIWLSSIWTHRSGSKYSLRRGHSSCSLCCRVEHVLSFHRRLRLAKIRLEQGNLTRFKTVFITSVVNQQMENSATKWNISSLSL